jgi:hypothetical protein
MADVKLTDSYETFNTASEWKSAVDKFIRENRGHEEYDFCSEEVEEENKDG